MNSTVRQQGFSLIEVLVAFFILTLAVAAAIRTTAASVDTAGQLRLRLLADWVAQDRLEERRVLGVRPVAGHREGSAVQGGSTFQWQETVAPMDTARVHRIEIAVALASDPATVLARRTEALIAAPN